MNSLSLDRTDAERPVQLAEYILSRRTTVRRTAAAFGISKSTVHKDLTERLPKLSPSLSRRVRRLLEENKEQRHIRGGEATRRKYRGKDK